MEVIRGSYNLKPKHHGCVATFGDFDGVHLGHQQLLQQVIEKARTAKLPATVITNEPLSGEYFAANSAPPRLTKLREKLAVFQSLSIDRVVVQEFNHKLVAISAEQYVAEVLVNKLGVRHLIIGDDTRFGHKRQGDFKLLQSLSDKLGFQVSSTESHLGDGERISSSRIRAALEQGAMHDAERLLGRRYHMSGRVAHGDKRGRDLGFPTANIYLNRRQSPVLGIFAVQVGGIKPQPIAGVASIGVRPTFGGGQCLLEVFIFDFDGDIYGRHVDIIFHKKLRDELHFDSVDALIKQMQIDAQQAREYFQLTFAETQTNR